MNQKVITNKLLGLIIATIMITGCGEPYRNAASKLRPRLYQVLIQQRVCDDENDCRKKDVMLGEYGNRVNIHLYGIKDEKIVAALFSVVLEEAPALTDNAPITIRVFATPKSENLGLKSAFGLNTPLYKLEMNP